MWPDTDYAPARGSFERPVPIVGVDPDATPVAAITVSCAWVPYIIGALYQLVLQSTWIVNDSLALTQEQMRAMTLISMFSQALTDGACGSAPFVPIVCPFDFSTGEQFGWAPNVTGCATYAVWLGGAWKEGCNPCCGGDTTELRVHKTFATSTMYGVTVRVTAITAHKLYVYGSWGIVGPFIVPAGIDVETTAPVGASTGDIEIALIGDPGEFSGVQLDYVSFLLATPTGECP